MQGFRRFFIHFTSASCLLQAFWVALLVAMQEKMVAVKEKTVDPGMALSQQEGRTAGAAF